MVVIVGASLASDYNNFSRVIGLPRGRCLLMAASFEIGKHVMG